MDASSLARNIFFRRGRHTPPWKKCGIFGPHQVQGGLTLTKKDNKNSNYGFITKGKLFK